ncbi:MAG: hypothetical protein KBC38_01400 [Candidatus Pacebacteria bacterium]|nr:hypothetical protein [Candidatus Paceibacterota bacterium]MBP9840291.1 hypothetical protein [Candidatus Paceibacterota bacterium]
MTPATIEFSFLTSAKGEPRTFENWWFPDFEGQLIAVRYEALQRKSITWAFFGLYLTLLEYDLKELCLTRLRVLMKEGGLIGRPRLGGSPIPIPPKELAEGYERAKRTHPHDIRIRLLRPLFPNG